MWFAYYVSQQRLQWISKEAQHGIHPDSPHCHSNKQKTNKQINIDQKLIRKPSTKWSKILNVKFKKIITKKKLTQLIVRGHLCSSPLPEEKKLKTCQKINHQNKPQSLNNSLSGSEIKTVDVNRIIKSYIDKIKPYLQNCLGRKKRVTHYK